MKKVVIIGYAHSKNEVNWEEKDTEYWVMNDMIDVPKFDRLFDIHLDKYILDRPKNPNFFKNLQKIQNKIIYMQRRWDEIPCSTKFPLQMLQDEFQIPAMGDVLFATCTVSYMLALAIYEKFDEIEILGVDEAIDGEYKDEMPSVLFWIGVARGRGIVVNISDHSPLLKGYFLYGYEEEKQSRFNNYMIKEMTRIQEIKDAAIKNQEYFFSQENKCIGALTMLEHLKKIMNEI